MVDDACGLIAIAEVEHEAVSLLTIVRGNIEVSTEALQRLAVGNGTRILRVAQLIARRHEDNLVLVALVVARGTTLYDLEGRVLTHKHHILVIAGDGGWCRAADGHTREDRIADVATWGLPLNEVGLARLHVIDRVELQCQCAL